MVGKSDVKDDLAVELGVGRGRSGLSVVGDAGPSSSRSSTPSRGEEIERRFVLAGVRRG